MNPSMWCLGCWFSPPKGGISKTELPDGLKKPYFRMDFWDETLLFSWFLLDLFFFGMRQNPPFLRFLR